MHRGIETRSHRQRVIIVFINFNVYFCELNVLFCRTLLSIFKNSKTDVLSVVSEMAPETAICEDLVGLSRKGRPCKPMYEMLGHEG